MKSVCHSERAKIVFCNFEKISTRTSGIIFNDGLIDGVDLLKNCGAISNVIVLCDCGS